MSALSWPVGLMPSSVDLGLHRQSVRHQSDMTSQVQAVELGTEFWRMSVNMPARARADSGAQEAFFNQLVGGTQKVSAWHFGRPIPKGTMRGTPTLSANAAQFSRSMSLAGVFGVGRRWDFNGSLNGWRNFDNNADWGAWSASATAAIGVVGLPGIGTGELIFERGLTGGERFWGADARRITMRVKRPSGSPPWTGELFFGTTGHSYSYPYNALAAEPSWDAGGWGVAVWDMASAVGAADWGSSLITELRFDLYRGLSTTYVGRSAELDWIEVSNGPGTYAPGTLLAGDMIGVSGQLFQAAANADADAYGNMTVQTVNRVRTALSSGTAVAWYRPAVDFIVLEPESAYAHGVNGVAPVSFSLIEAP
jgi:hypothetical protein